MSDRKDFDSKDLDNRQHDGISRGRDPRRFPDAPPPARDLTGLNPVGNSHSDGMQRFNSRERAENSGIKREGIVTPAENNGQRSRPEPGSSRPDTLTNRAR